MLLQDFTALFAGKPRGDQRSGAARCFDNHNALLVI
jgi:hypothetical protein